MDDDPTIQIIDEMIADEAPRFTQGQMDAYATECLETERKRIHGILSRVLVKDNIEAIATGGLDDYLFTDYVETLQEILDKVILGNKK